jgi:hypothetical protein
MAGGLAGDAVLRCYGLGDRIRAFAIEELGDGDLQVTCQHGSVASAHSTVFLALPVHSTAIAQVEGQHL